MTATGSSGMLLHRSTPISITHSDAGHSKSRRSALGRCRPQQILAAVAGSSDPAAAWRHTPLSWSVRQTPAADRPQRQSHICRASPTGREKLPCELHLTCKAECKVFRSQGLNISYLLAVGETPKESSSRVLLLGTLFAGWYLFNIWFNV